MKYSIKSLHAYKSLLWSSTVGILSTLIVISPSLGFDIPEDNPKAVIDEIWQIVNNEFVDLEKSILVYES